MKTLHIMALAVFVVAANTVSAQTEKIRQVETRLTEYRDLVFEDSVVPRFHIQDRMKKYHIPSVSIAVINNGKIEWIKAYGLSDADRQVKATPQTLYQVASISKSVNAVAVMRLVQEGKLSLSQDIRQYLETWTFPDNALTTGKTITLRQLLSHTAGLSVHGFIGIPLGDSIPTINQILNGERPARNEPVVPIFAPGEKFEYSGGGITVVRKILDDQVSSNYDSLLHALVLDPLHMRSSSFSQPLQSSFGNFAYGHTKDEKALPTRYYLYPEQAAGGLWSTAGDIARFVIAIQEILNKGRTIPLQKEYARDMLTPVMNDYALGFGILEKGGEKYFWHEGESYGFNAIYYGSFRTGQGVVVLTNAYPENGQPFIRELVNSVATVYGWKDFYNPVKKKLYALTSKELERYTGEYVSEDGQIRIQITKTAEGLTLTARRPEKMYPEGNSVFFLASSPSDICRFRSSKGDGYFDIFEVEQAGKIIIRAFKK